MENETYVCGVSDSKYAMIHHAGPEKNVRKTYDALRRGSRASGLDESRVFMLKSTEAEAAILMRDQAALMKFIGAKK